MPEVSDAPSSSSEHGLDRPVIIVGAPRSGTTILSRLLQKHRQVFYIEEARLTWRYGNDGRSDLLRESDARPEVCQHIRTTFARALAESGAQRFVEKTPSNALRVPFVNRVLPNARFIHIMRHGVDSTLSIRKLWQEHAYGMTGLAPGRVKQRLKEINLKRLPHYAKEVARRALPRKLSGVLGQAVWGPRIPGIEQMVRELDLLEVCALQWRMCVELASHAGRRLPPERYFECRLEDLDESLLRKILDFCELPEDEQIDQFFATEFDASRTGARKAEADSSEVDRILEWIEPTLRWLNYDT